MQFACIFVLHRVWINSSRANAKNVRWESTILQPNESIEFHEYATKRQIQFPLKAQPTKKNWMCGLIVVRRLVVAFALSVMRYALSVLRLHQLPIHKMIPYSLMNKCNNSTMF